MPTTVSLNNKSINQSINQSQILLLSWKIVPSQKLHLTHFTRYTVQDKRCLLMKWISYPNQLTWWKIDAISYKICNGAGNNMLTKWFNSSESLLSVFPSILLDSTTILKLQIPDCPIRFFHNKEMVSLELSTTC